MGQNNAKVNEKFLVFMLNDQQYGIDINKAVSIIKYDIKLTRVPRAPVYIKGVINLRGSIVPIIDLRKKLGFDEVDFTKEARIIVLELENDFAGVIVDKIEGVEKVSSTSINDIANMGNNKINNYLSGVYQKDSKIISIFNLEKLLNIEIEK